MVKNVQLHVIFVNGHKRVTRHIISQCDFVKGYGIIPYIQMTDRFIEDIVGPNNDTIPFYSFKSNKFGFDFYQPEALKSDTDCMPDELILTLKDQDSKDDYCTILEPGVWINVDTENMTRLCDDAIYYYCMNMIVTNKYHNNIKNNTTAIIDEFLDTISHTQLSFDRHENEDESNDECCDGNCNNCDDTDCQNTPDDDSDYEDLDNDAIDIIKSLHDKGINIIDLGKASSLDEVMTNLRDIIEDISCTSNHNKFSKISNENNHSISKEMKERIKKVKKENEENLSKTIESINHLNKPRRKCGHRKTNNPNN